MDKYPDFIETCGYGDILGICGISCRHSFSPFYPGVSINTYKTLDKDANKEKYENEQKQRAMERAIRETKRRKEVLDSAEQTEEIKNKRSQVNKLLKDRSARYLKFCSENNLSTANWRLKIAKTGVENV